MVESLRDNPLAMLVLDKLIHYINHWDTEDRDEKLLDVPLSYQPLTIEDFFKYEGQTQLLGDISWSSGRQIVMSAGTGDEGGPSILFAFFDKNVYAGLADNEWELNYIVHHFDTHSEMIYGESYEKGHIGWIYTRDNEIGEVDAMGLKMGLQEYTKEEQQLQSRRPIVKEA